jgi:crotonobetainyl-CoA:carnitine CoA-transferase CaiB-like acyl-CoA transferase
MTTSEERSASMPDRPRASRAPSVTLIGDCELVLASALVFKMLHWDLRLICDPAQHARAWRKLGVFASDGAVSVEAAPGAAASPPDILVSCGDDAAPHGVAGPRTTHIELLGTRYDDGEQSWQSCSELIAYMRSGLASITRERDDEGLTGAPYLIAGRLPAFFLACHAAMVACAVLEAGERPSLITLTAQECMLATLHSAAAFAQIEGRDIARVFGGRQAGGRYRCTDGQLLISLPDPYHWEKLVAVLGNPQWSIGEWWRDPAARFANRDLFSAALTQWCRDQTLAEAIATLQAAGIPAAYLASASDVLANEQLAARNFVLDAPPETFPFERPFRVTSRAAPGEGEATPDRAALILDPTQIDRDRLPLRELRVCDLSWVWAGPYLTRHLGMLGATVTRVEGAQRIDVHRMLAPFVAGEEPEHDRSSSHLFTNRSKLSIAVDLKHPDGLATVKDLIANSDVLIDNFSPGTLDRLGLDFETVARIAGARGFVYLSLSGFGAGGPWSAHRSYGAQLADLTGLSALTGGGGEPVSVGIPIADPLAGTFGAAVMLNALRESREQGAPVHIEIAQFEVLVAGIADALLAGEAQGNRRSGDFAGTGVYACAGEQHWIAIDVPDEEAMQRLAEVVGAADDAAAPDPEARLEARTTRWAAARSSEEAAAQLRSRGIESTEVLSAAELLHDPSLLAAGYWVPALADGHSDLRAQNAPWLFDGERRASVRPAPRLGEHTDMIARSLGYSDARVAELKASGAIT